MFKSQAKEEHYYIVQDNVEQLGEWAEPQPNQSNLRLHQLNQRKQRKCGGR
jgi:hypothetical protein